MEGLAGEDPVAAGVGADAADAAVDVLVLHGCTIRNPQKVITTLAFRSQLKDIPAEIVVIGASFSTWIQKILAKALTFEKSPVYANRCLSLSINTDLNTSVLSPSHRVIAAVRMGVGSQRHRFSHSSHRK